MDMNGINCEIFELTFLVQIYCQTTLQQFTMIFHLTYDFMNKYGKRI